MPLLHNVLSFPFPYLLMIHIGHIYGCIQDGFLLLKMSINVNVIIHLQTGVPTETGEPAKLGGYDIIWKSN